MREILRKDFDGRPINEVNLTDWKNGGFLDWQAQQEALMLIQELKSNSEEFAKVLPGEIAEPLTKAVVAQRQYHLERAEQVKQMVRDAQASLNDRN